MGDIEDYISEHIYGNYYFWGNNSYAQYDKWEENEEWENATGELGQIGLGEDTGWEEWSEKGNPCDSDEGEYLPTPDDWEELMSIWSNINGENHNRYVEMSIPDGREHYSIGLNHYHKFASDILIPDAGYYSKSCILPTSLNNTIQSVCQYGSNREYNSYPSLLWTAKSDRGMFGVYNSYYGELSWTTEEAGTKEYVNNAIAAPVRCFIDPDEVNGVEKYTVTFDTKGGNETVPTQTVKEGKKLKEPATPTRDRYTFDGWYTSNGTKWNFGTDTVQGEMTLYAKWRLCGEGFVVEDNKCIPEGMELNGVIKVTGELGTMYIRDRNVGVSDAAVKWLKFNTLDRLVENECNQSNNYRVCWDTKGLNKFNKIFGTNYTSIEEARNELYYELQLEVLEGVLSEKEMTAFEINMLRSQCSERNDQSLGTSSTSDGLNVNSMYTDMDCMDSVLLIYVKEKFNKTFENVDEAYDYLEEYFGSDVDLVYEIWNAYDGNYYTYNGDYINFFIDFYDLNLDAQAYGNYYYRGNNSGVNYNDIKFEDPNDDSRITNTGDLIKKGFTEGKIGVEGQGWIDGNPNPCDPEKGEYLPTPEDWRDLMTIWANSNNATLTNPDLIQNSINISAIDSAGSLFFEDIDLAYQFANDMLIPEAGYIGYEKCGGEPDCEDYMGYNMVRNSYFGRTSMNKNGYLGLHFFPGLLYTNEGEDNEYINNYIAYPVRCFVNPAEIPDVYVVSYETNGGNDIPDVNVIGGDTVILPTPSKANYTFGGWYTDKALTQTFNSSMPVISDLTLYAKWTQGQTSTPVSSYSGGGRKKAESVTNMHNSADEKDSTQNDAKGSENPKTSTNSSSNVSEGQTQNLDMNQYNTTYTPEQNRAYQFAKSHGITTTSSIREAKMNTPLTRIEMAKMLSYYAVNVLGMIPQHGAGVANFKDVSADLDEKYDYGVALAYQLGIMGINMPNNEFRPYDKVTRAEFATALSRMLYDMEDGKGRIKYYEPHMARLYNEGIINNTNPKMEELRGYVMTMLMRTVK